MFSNAFTELGVEAETYKRDYYQRDKKFLVKIYFFPKKLQIKMGAKEKRRRMHALDMSDANIEHLIMPLGPGNRPRGTVHLSPRAGVNVFEDFSDGWPDPLPNRNKPKQHRRRSSNFERVPPPPPPRYLALSLDASRNCDSFQT